MALKAKKGRVPFGGDVTDRRWLPEGGFVVVVVVVVFFVFFSRLFRFPVVSSEVDAVVDVVFRC